MQAMFSLDTQRTCQGLKVRKVAGSKMVLRCEGFKRVKLCAPASVCNHADTVTEQLFEVLQMKREHHFQ
jgi:hypothetical protein